MPHHWCSAGAGDKCIPVHCRPLFNLNESWSDQNKGVCVLRVWSCGLCHPPTVEQTQQCRVFQGSAYGGRFTLSASSCGSIKGLAEWICRHLLWTKIQGAELYSAKICNVCLDLTLHALHTDNTHCPVQTWARARDTAPLCTLFLLVFTIWLYNHLIDEPCSVLQTHPPYPKWCTPQFFNVC